MKRKHGRESSRVKVITDPKKLAWLKAEIEKKKAGFKPGGNVEEDSPEQRVSFRRGVFVFRS
jgi:hypothetical protein